MQDAQTKWWHREKHGIDIQASNIKNAGCQSTPTNTYIKIEPEERKTNLDDTYGQKTGEQQRQANGSKRGRNKNKQECQKKFGNYHHRPSQQYSQQSTQQVAKKHRYQNRHIVSKKLS